MDVSLAEIANVNSNASLLPLGQFVDATIASSYTCSLHKMQTCVVYHTLTCIDIDTVGYETSSGESSPCDRSQYTPVYNNMLVKALDDIKDNISTKSFQVIDARSMGRFTGQAPEPRPGVYIITCSLSVDLK